VSLKGSLQTVALPEVLHFLSGTGKSGEFQVSGSHGDGRLWFAQGRISGFAVARSQQPEDALFEMLRIADGEGEFSFSADIDRPDDAQAADSAEVGPVLQAAQVRMGQWREIVQVVPSLQHRLQLRADAPGERVTLEPDQWTTVVTIAGGLSVGDLIEARHLQEFDGCQAVRVLVDASLVEVLEPAEAAEAEADPAEPGVEPVVEAGADEHSVESALHDIMFPSIDSKLHSEPVEEATDHQASVEGFGIPGQLLRFGAEPEVTEESAGEVGEEEPFGTSPSAKVADLDEGETVFSHFPVSSNGVDVEIPAPSYETEPESAAHAEQHSDDSDHSEDHYAALRAAMVEVGENLSTDGQVAEAEVSEEQPVFELHAESELDGHAALQALLGEVTSPEAADMPSASAQEPIDGLADRGPWTQHELSAMDGDGAWSHRDEEPSNIVPLAPVYGSSESAEPVSGGHEVATDETADGEVAEADEPEAGPTEEPINRGLLLKFLSSVRN
jgi:hypothetical protein